MEKNQETLLIGILTEILTNRSHLQAIESELINLKAIILEPSDRPQFFKDETERIHQFIDNQVKKLNEDIKKAISQL